MTPNGCGAATNTVKDVKGRNRAATIMQAMIISLRTHLLGYHRFNMKFKMILLQGGIYPMFLRMILVTGKLYGD